MKAQPVPDSSMIDEAKDAVALYDEDGFLDNNDLQRVMPLVRWALSALETAEIRYRANGDKLAILKLQDGRQPSAIMEQWIENELDRDLWPT